MKIKKVFLIGVMCACSVLGLARGEIRAQEVSPKVQEALDEAEQNVPPSQPEPMPPEETQGNTGQENQQENVSQPTNLTEPSVGQPAPVTSAQQGTPTQSLTMGESTTIDVLELKDMDIGDVLKLISKKSGLNIVSGKTVAGKVTIYLKNIDVHDALRIIL
ncbi:MAG: hypothetical protein NT079_00515, partial [Candidatus Omnitrophica bacterium]|nr:hypothetical protein [Candidatus Omnitrophota bacterium]